MLEPLPAVELPHHRANRFARQLPTDAAFGWLAFLPSLVLPKAWAALLAVVLFAMGGALEVAQDMLPYRSGSLGDI